MKKERIRCPWCLGFDQYIEYHDTEWGVPVHDDKKAFADFDVETVAEFTEKQLEGLLLDPSIIRNRLKVYAAANNARKFLEVQKEFGSFDKYIWGFVKGKPIVNKWKTLKQIKP